MNDTDTYDAKHRVAYHPDPAEPPSAVVDPRGHGRETTIANRGAPP